MPKADATELAPKKSAYRNPPAHTPSVLEGFWFLPRATQRFLRSAHFFGEAPSGGLGLSNAKIARLLFARRSKSRLLDPTGRRDTGVAYTGEYPIPRASSADSFSSAPRRREAEKPAGDYRENVGGDNCGALQLGRPRQLAGYDSDPEATMAPVLQNDSSQGLVERGTQLFHDNCASCHGIKGLGDGIGADGLFPRPANLSMTRVFRPPFEPRSVERSSGLRDAAMESSRDT